MRSWRRTVVVTAAATAAAAAVGAGQLLAGVFTPPVEDLAPLGLDSWALPGLWLAASVAVPCAAAAVLAARRSPAYPAATILAGLLLAVELVVQVPFVGPDPLQAVMGLVAVALVVMGRAARPLHTS